MPTDINLSKVQLTKTIQSGGFLGAFLDKLARQLMKVAVPLTKNVFALLATMTPACEIDGAIQRKMCRRSVVIERKGITLVILDKDMDDFIRFIKSLENTDVLIDGVSEIVKHETKN